MKKLIIKSVIMVVLMIGFSNYMLYIMTGKSPFAETGLSMPKFSVNAPKINNMNPLADGNTVYKWVDENGVTQYSSEPPPANIAKQTLELDPNTNIVQGLRPEDEEEETPHAGPSEPILPQGPIYSPENVKKLIDDAKNVQNLLNERYQKQEEMLKDL